MRLKYVAHVPSNPHTTSRCKKGTLFPTCFPKVLFFFCIRDREYVARTRIEKAFVSRRHQPDVSPICNLRHSNDRRNILSQSQTSYGDRQSCLHTTFEVTYLAVHLLYSHRSMKQFSVHGHCRGACRFFTSEALKGSCQ